MSISRRLVGAILLSVLSTWSVTTLEGCGGASCLRDSDCGSELECREGACVTPSGSPPAAGKGGSSAGTAGSSAGVSGSTSNVGGSAGTTSSGGKAGASGNGGVSGASAGMAGRAGGGMSGSASEMAGAGDMGGSP